MAEKNYYNFLLKYDQYLNLKGISSVRRKKLLASLLRPQEGVLSKILLMCGSSKHKITRLPLTFFFIIYN